MSHYRFRHRLSIVDAIAALYRYSVNDFYSKSCMLSIMVPILTNYMLSIRSLYRYLNAYSIFCPIGCLYRLTIISLYRYIYLFVYKIVYKWSLYFGIPGVYAKKAPHTEMEIVWKSPKSPPSDM
jgi:hypothetical protein